MSALFTRAKALLKRANCGPRRKGGFWALHVANSKAGPRTGDANKSTPDLAPGLALLARPMGGGTSRGLGTRPCWPRPHWPCTSAEPTGFLPSLRCVGSTLEDPPAGASLPPAVGGGAGRTSPKRLCRSRGPGRHRFLVQGPHAELFAFLDQTFVTHPSQEAAEASKTLSLPRARRAARLVQSPQAVP